MDKETPLYCPFCLFSDRQSKLVDCRSTNLEGDRGLRACPSCNASFRIGDALRISESLVALYKYAWGIRQGMLNSQQLSDTELALLTRSQAELFTLWPVPVQELAQILFHGHAIPDRTTLPCLSLNDIEQIFEKTSDEVVSLDKLRVDINRLVRERTEI